MYSDALTDNSEGTVTILTNGFRRPQRKPWVSSCGCRHFFCCCRLVWFCMRKRTCAHMFASVCECTCVYDYVRVCILYVCKRVRARVSFCVCAWLCVHVHECVTFISVTLCVGGGGGGGIGRWGGWKLARVHVWVCAEKRERASDVCLLVGCLMSQQHAFYLRDGSAETNVRAATFR